MDTPTTNITAIPLSWFYDYLDSLPKDSKSRLALGQMFFKFMRDQESKTSINLDGSTTVNCDS